MKLINHSRYIYNLENNKDSFLKVLRESLNNKKFKIQSSNKKIYQLINKVLANKEYSSLIYQSEYTHYNKIITKFNCLGIEILI